eukprot:4321145-Ditylum_brightwellii.AAC.1
MLDNSSQHIPVQNTRRLQDVQTQNNPQTRQRAQWLQMRICGKEAHATCGEIQTTCSRAAWRNAWKNDRRCNSLHGT